MLSTAVLRSAVLLAGLLTVETAAIWAEAVPPEPWTQIIGTVGFPIAVAMFIGAMVWRYLPPLVKAHTDFTSRVADATEATQRLLADITVTQRDICHRLDHTHQELADHLETLCGEQTKTREAITTWANRKQG